MLILFNCQTVNPLLSNSSRVDSFVMLNIQGSPDRKLLFFERNELLIQYNLIRLRLWDQVPGPVAGRDQVHGSQQQRIWLSPLPPSPEEKAQAPETAPGQGISMPSTIWWSSEVQPKPMRSWLLTGQGSGVMSKARPRRPRQIPASGPRPESGSSTSQTQGQAGGLLPQVAQERPPTEEGGTRVPPPRTPAPGTDPRGGHGQASNQPFNMGPRTAPFRFLDLIGG